MEELEEIGDVNVANVRVTFFTDQAKTKLFCAVQQSLPFAVARTQILNFIGEKYPGAKIDDDVLKDCFAKPSPKPRRIGTSKLPKDPIDEKLILLAKPFKLDDRTGLRFLDNIEPEREVARITPPQAGENGYNIFGETIPSREPKRLNIKIGSGLEVRNTDRHKSLISKVYGYLHYDQTEIDVKEELTINGDVTHAIGNIRFNNRLKINGNVGIGFVLKSDRGILVQGDVFKDSELYSSLGSVTVVGSVTQSKIVAKEMITVEKSGNSYLSAEKIVIKQACTGCEVYCDEFEAKICAGGSVTATRRVSVEELGNSTGVSTVVVIAQSRENERSIQDLSNQLKQVSRAIQIIKLQLGPYEFKNPKDLPSELRDRIANLREKMQKLESAAGVLRSKLKELLESSRQVFGEVFVSKTAYEGCEFRFGHEELVLKEPVKGPVTIRLLNDRISM